MRKKSQLNGFAFHSKYKNDSHFLRSLVRVERKRTEKITLHESFGYKNNLYLRLNSNKPQLLEKSNRAHYRRPVNLLIILQRIVGKKGSAMESYLDKNNSEKSDSERNEIRSEISNMSFEDLQKLKAELGQKVYKEAMFGVRSRQIEFKRKNKNCPREVSSKILPTVKTKVKQKRICDPRFDRLCGTFNEKHFQNTYGFLLDIKQKEKAQLKKMLKNKDDPVEVNKIKYLLQRLENQEREEIKKNKVIESMKNERKEQIKALKSGKKPHFRTKYERKLVQLVDKYSDLKKTGKIEKYIEKKQKKQNMRTKQKRYFEVDISDNEKD